jgi:hypothetical protein
MDEFIPVHETVNSATLSVFRRLFSVQPRPERTLPMLLKISTAAVALIAASAIAGAASAQNQTNFAGADQANPTGAAPASATTSDATSAPAATSTDTTGYNVGTPQVDPNTGAQIVTNGPVPDTRANRARFGQPDSHAGRRTAPAGN